MDRRKQKKAPINAEAQEELSVEQLQEMLQTKKDEQIKKAEAEIEAIAQKYGLSIGCNLDAQRLADVVRFMVQSKQEKVSLKYEIW